MFKSIEKIALNHEYMVILCDTHNSPSSEINYAQKLVQRKIDGLIYATYTMNRESQDYFINLSRQLPIVFVDFAFKGVKDISIVATDGYNSTRSAVRYLYQKGRRNIAYINFPKDVLVTKHRFEGYKRGLEDCGLPFNTELVCYPDSSSEIDVRQMGSLGAKALMSASTVPDAIMGAADPLAIGAMKYLKKQGVRIPQDLSLIGFDNNEVCEIVEPSLTTIAQPTDKIGTMAAKMLFNKINETVPTNGRVILEAELTLRSST